MTASAPPSSNTSPLTTPFGSDVTLEDLGTPSLDLPAYLAGYDTVIFVDAVAADAPPGTIRTFSRDQITSVPTGIRVSPHEPTINDALIILDFAGTAPRNVVLVGVVPETLDGGMTLSLAVAGAVAGAADVVLFCLEQAQARDTTPDKQPDREAALAC